MHWLKPGRVAEIEFAGFIGDVRTPIVPRHGKALDAKRVHQSDRVHGQDAAVAAAECGNLRQV
jgi:hypothetical protein